MSIKMKFAVEVATAAAAFTAGTVVAHAATPPKTCEFTAYDGGYTAVVITSGSPNCTGKSFTINAPSSSPYGGPVTFGDFTGYLEQVGESVSGPAAAHVPSSGLVGTATSIYTNGVKTSVYEVPNKSGLNGTFGIGVSLSELFKSGSPFGPGAAVLPTSPASSVL